MKEAEAIANSLADPLDKTAKIFSDAKSLRSH